MVKEIKKMKKIIFIVLCFNIMLSNIPGLTAWFNFPYTKTFTLDNGMKVALSTNYETPLVNIAFLVNHGTLDDPLGTRGYGKRIAKNLFGALSEEDMLQDYDKYHDDFEKLGILVYRYRGWIL